MQTIEKEVLIVGGGTAGITVAARLKRAGVSSITIVDPANNHYYQPLWTLVGGGISRFKDSGKSMGSVIPKGVQWLQKSVREFIPDKNMVVTSDGQSLHYCLLVVCPGIQIDWDKIEGLTEALGEDGVCSNYSESTCAKTWEFIKNFQGGRSIFTFPSTPIKCAGAPQKIMYLAEHHWRIRNIRDQCTVSFMSAGAGIFGVKKYADALNAIIRERGIETKFKRNLIKINASDKIATFVSEGGDKVEEPYDFIHVTPPMSAPDFIKQSPISNEAGWVDVDKHTLQHNKYPNIFSLGDASSLPTSKTGAAIRKEAPVLVQNLISHRSGRQLTKKYDGYTSCPLVTGYGTLILAEFDYDGKPKETFPFDQSKERFSMYLFKKHLLPLLYWRGMLKGRL